MFIMYRSNVVFQCSLEFLNFSLIFEGKNHKSNNLYASIKILCLSWPAKLQIKSYDWPSNIMHSGIINTHFHNHFLYRVPFSPFR